ncbi:MAG: ECF transporter S component [Blautia sp.]|nr:ECF transporter S component [Blautia sp.]
MLAAVSFILMFLDFPVPFMPGFIKFDVSELPALIGSFAMGPACGVLICLIKNLLHLTITTTGGVGELSNFVLGAMFVLPAGCIYKRKKTKKTAIIGSFTGALLMAGFSVISNYFIVYPFYYNFMPEEAIIGAYNAILQVAAPSAELTSVLPCLIGFNMPFTFLKGLACTTFTLLLYKRISPILKGTDN